MPAHVASISISFNFEWWLTTCNTTTDIKTSFRCVLHLEKKSKKRSEVNSSWPSAIFMLSPWDCIRQTVGFATYICECASRETKDAVHHAYMQHICRNELNQYDAWEGFCKTVADWLSAGQNITVTSQWAQYRLKSPAPPLFTQPFIQTQFKENIKAPRHWPLCGNSP